MTSPVASVVLLNWNSGDFGHESLEALELPRGQFEVIVVDNASSDDSLGLIVAAVEADLVVRNGTNVGFGAGMNSGIARATTPFVLPLNCDVMLDPRYVETAIGVMDRNPTCAVVGGAVAWVETLPSPIPAIIDEPAEGPMDLTLTMRTLARPPLGGRCSKATGACPVSRMAALADVMGGEGVGPYDPVFDTYGEDVDLAIKLHRAGWEVHYEPEMRAVHARSFSSARKLADKRGPLRRNVIRGRWLSIIRHLPASKLPLAVLVALAEDVGFVARQLLRRDGSAASDTLAAWHFVLGRLPTELGYRRAHRSTLDRGPHFVAPDIRQLLRQARRS